MVLLKRTCEGNRSGIRNRVESDGNKNRNAQGTSVWSERVSAFVRDVVMRRGS